MKRCPFCAEEIQDPAIKCKHCGEFLEEPVRTVPPQTAQKWYFRKAYIFLILACIGPLGLPLIWWHPRLQRRWKVVLTVLILLLTWLLVAATIESLKVLQESYSELQQMLDM